MELRRSFLDPFLLSKSHPIIMDHRRAQLDLAYQEFDGHYMPILVHGQATSVHLI